MICCCSCDSSCEYSTVCPPPILLILLSCIPFSTQMRRCLSLNHSLIGCFLCLAFFLAKVLRPPSFVLSPHHNAQHRFCRCIIGSVFPYHDWLPDIVHRVGERYRTRPFFFLLYGACMSDSFFPSYGLRVCVALSRILFPLAHYLALGFGFPTSRVCLCLHHFLCIVSLSC